MPYLMTTFAELLDAGLPTAWTDAHLQLGSSPQGEVGVSIRNIRAHADLDDVALVDARLGPGIVATMRVPLTGAVAIRIPSDKERHGASVAERTARHRAAETTKGANA